MYWATRAPTKPELRQHPLGVRQPRARGRRSRDAEPSPTSTRPARWAYHDPGRLGTKDTLVRISPRVYRSALTPPLLALCLAALSACGAGAVGSKQIIEVASQPPGATVVVAGTDMRATTPALIEIDRRWDAVVLVFGMDGYESAERRLQRTRDRGVLGYVLFGATMGALADETWKGQIPGRLPAPVGGAILGFASGFFLGATHMHSPSAVSVTLSPTPTEAPEQTP